MWPQSRVRVVSSQIGRCNHELKALCVGGRRAVTLVHIATANPIRAGCNPHLIAGAVVAHGGPGRMRAMAIVVARSDCVRTAGATTGVNGIVPVEIVIGGNTIPAAILRLKRAMGPSHPGIQVPYYHPLAGKT